MREARTSLLALAILAATGGGALAQAAGDMARTFRPMPLTTADRQLMNRCKTLSKTAMMQDTQCRAFTKTHPGVIATMTSGAVPAGATGDVLTPAQAATGSVVGAGGIGPSMPTTPVTH